MTNGGRQAQRHPKGSEQEDQHDREQRLIGEDRENAAAEHRQHRQRGCARVEKGDMTPARLLGGNLQQIVGKTDPAPADQPHQEKRGEHDALHMPPAMFPVICAITSIPIKARPTPDSPCTYRM